jgi:hypothetical protein
MSWKRYGREKEQLSFKINREKRGRSIEEKKKKRYQDQYMLLVP